MQVWATHVLYLPNKNNRGRNSFKGFKVYLLQQYPLFRSRNIFKNSFFFASSVIFLYIQRWKYYTLNVDLNTQLETKNTIRTNL